MNFDIDSILLPWDLTITVAGNSYRVRPIRNIDAARLTSAGVAGDMKAIESIQSLFEEPEPDVVSWEADQLKAVASIITAYFKDRAEKNSRLISDKIAAEMGTTTAAPAASRSGSSSPR
jgi:hypothetical protein